MGLFIFLFRDSRERIVGLIFGASAG